MNGLKRLYDQPCSASPDWGMLLGSSHSPNMGMIRGSGPPILPPAVQANNHGCCSSSSLFFPGFPQLNSRYSMIGAAAADTMGYGLNSSSKNNSSSSSSSNNNSRIHVYGGGTSLVLDGARGELVSASKMMTPKEILEAKAAAASKSHSEAERRRRERINNHLATLRTLLPSSTKTDKASLLAEVIEHLKDLKRRASQIEQGIAVPSDVDELRVEADDADDDDDDDAAETTSGDDDSTEEQQLLLQQQTDKNRKPETKPITCSSGGGEGEGGGRRRRKGVVIKASLCCDDRPDLLADLNRTLHALRLKAVKAEISTLGGRTKNVFLMTTTTSNSNSISSSSSSLMDNDRGDAISPSLSRIQEALRAVMERAAAAAAAAASNDLFSHSNKRQRLLPLEASSGSAM